MPVITVEGPEIPDLDTKRKLARDFTAAASEAYRLPEEAIIVILHETSPECVASGGELICDRRASARDASSIENTAAARVAVGDPAARRGGN
jgi:4-oxalocrotonate tautomerase